MVEINIKDGDAGQRLNKYLMKYLSLAPSSFVYKMLRKKNIVLNDKKAQGDEIIKSGDVIKLYLADETIAKFKGDKGLVTSDKSWVTNLSRNLKILYEDSDIMAVHKEPGILSQKANKEDYSINEAIVDYVASSDSYNHSETFKPSVCNRLDKNTSGIILAGITLKGSQYLSRVLKDRSIDKYYFTIVKGELKNNITCEAYISKDSDKNLSKVITCEDFITMNKHGDLNFRDYSKIVTEFIPISTNKKSTLLKIKLITGKTHQIRAHLKHLGFPLAGDMKYGDKTYNSYMKDKYGLKTHLLHAGIVKLSDNLVINDPLPEIFIKICEGEKLDVKSII